MNYKGVSLCTKLLGQVVTKRNVVCPKVAPSVPKSLNFNLSARRLFSDRRIINGKKNFGSFQSLRQLRHFASSDPRLLKLLIGRRQEDRLWAGSDTTRILKTRNLPVKDETS